MLIFSLRVQLVLYAFALSLSTAAIKTFSVLSELSFPVGFYIVGGLLSVLFFSIFGSFIASLLWKEMQELIPSSATPPRSPSD